MLFVIFTYLEIVVNVLSFYKTPNKKHVCLSVFCVLSHVFYTVFAHLFANRGQLYNQDGSSLSPENVARELGFSEEAEPCDMRRENQRQETDQSSRQECGYAMLTPRTMMVIFN